jgi:Zn-dependent protease with chaperone function
LALTGIDPGISFVLDRRLLVGDLFPDTHPEAADRIERLQSMAADLERPP